MFDELKRTGEIEFQFADKEEPLEYATKLTSKMQEFKTEEDAKALLLKHCYMVEEFDKPRV